jgi:hypothetical protein
MIKEKAATIGLALAIAGLFAYAEVARREREIQLKQHEYQKIVRNLY